MDCHNRNRLEELIDEIIDNEVKEHTEDREKRMQDAYEKLYITENKLAAFQFTEEHSKKVHKMKEVYDDIDYILNNVAMYMELNGHHSRCTGDSDCICGYTYLGLIINTRRKINV